MNVYYVAGFPLSDELYHHSIQGQKWGIRRYQNPDGTLTPEGRARYGNNLGKYANESGIIRKYASSEGIYGGQRHREIIEKRLKRKIDSGKANEEDIIKYKAQKQKNIDMETYLSRQSTGKLFVQSILLGDNLGADRYRQNRVRGDSRAISFVKALATPKFHINPFNNTNVADKLTYGVYLH